MEVELEVDAGVAVLTLNAPQRRNALTPQMAREMVDALGRVDADESIAALVIRGADGRFCAGAHTGTLDGAGAGGTAPKAGWVRSFASMRRVSPASVARTCAR